MCGLFGIFGPGIIDKDIEILKQLGLVSQLRGLDGAGVFEANTRSKILRDGYLEKGADAFSYFLTDVADTHKPKLLDNIYNTLYMGHVRAATKGIINDQNAHPFDVGRYVIAHNGTLRDKKYDHNSKADSMLMAEDINKRGILPVLKDLQGGSAYAMSIYDREENKFYLVRNSLRPLHLAYNTTRSVVYYASEHEFLKMILERNNITNSKYFYVKEHTLLSITPEDQTVGKDKIWTTETYTPTFKVERSKAAKGGRFLQPGDAWYDDWEFYAAQQEKQEEKKKEEPKREEKKIVNLSDRINQKEMEVKKRDDDELYWFQSKCSGCGAILDPLDKHLGHHNIENDTYKCSSCKIEEFANVNPGVSVH